MTARRSRALPFLAGATVTLALLAVLTAALLTLGIAPATSAPGAQDRAGAFFSAAPTCTRGVAPGSPCTRPGSASPSSRIAVGCCVAAKGSGALDRLAVRLADETGAVGKYGNLGNLASRADETLADVIRSRGGGASQIRQLQTGYGERTLGELSELAASGDREAVRAIKMAKQAGSQGKGGR